MHLTKPLLIVTGLILLIGLIVSGTQLRASDQPLPGGEETAQMAMVRSTATSTSLPTSTPEPTATPMPTATALPTVDPAVVERGYEVYRTSYCAACHALSAIGAGSTLAPSHDGLGQTAAARIQAASYKGNAATAAEYIRESIVDPSVYIVEDYVLSNHRMPAFTHLSEADIEALVVMLLQQ